MYFVRVSAGPDQGLSTFSPLSPLPSPLLHLLPLLGGQSQEGFAADATVWGGKNQTLCATWRWSTPRPPCTCSIPTPCPYALPGTPRVFQRVPPYSSVPEGWGLLCPPSQPFLPSPFSSFFFPPPSKHNKSAKSPTNEKPLFVPLFPLLSATAKY